VTVRIGHAKLEERRYRNPSRPYLGIETLTLTDLRRRLSDQAMRLPHRLDFHQITLITRGKGCAVIDFNQHPCRNGTLLHVRPGQVQGLPRAAEDGDDDVDARIVLFTADFPGRSPSITALVDNWFGTSSWDLAETDYRTFDQAMIDLAAEYDRREPSIDLLRGLLTILLIRIGRLAAPGTDHSAAAPETFTLFPHELERSFAVTRRAGDYAVRLSCSLKTLTRVCQAATGRTAKELIDARVALEAKRLLAHTDLPTAAIGRRLEFTEATNFIKYFARQAGQTPGAFRTAQMSQTDTSNDPPPP
jgi:AraC-like DNA-binding protein